ncbi:MAG TPA: hypothetical protein VGK32_15600 [Vicinamibacterales bacterium]|jgi:sugar lactone lactonase YvrE
MVAFHTPRPRIVPARAVDGGCVTIEAGADPFSVDPPPFVRLGGVHARVVTASSRRVRVVVPGEIMGGRVPVTFDAVEPPIGFIEIGTRVATGLHQVDSPAFDADGNLYVTCSGTRGQRVPVSIFRIRPDGTREVLVTGLVNATSLAFDPFGALCVSSRFDGTVYRVTADGRVEKIASELGVACGIAFLSDGTMFVGDRGGTLFRVNAAGRVILWATLPASVAAYHLAVAADESVYVSGPTLSTRDAIYRVDRRGEVTRAFEGFGRPQGLAFGQDGALHVAEAVAGASGIYRVDSDGSRTLMVAGAALVGLAIHPVHGVAVASNDTVYRLDAF